ncbi:MAG: DoxX family protein [Acidobacteriales bacterium]|nr:DoxX family protein [Terriglobales bacterium]
MPDTRWLQLQAVALNLLRIIVGFLFIPHGAQKLFGALGGQAVPLASQFGVAGILEFFGGLLILIGLFTRPVAFILAGEMAAAYFMVHAPRLLADCESRRTGRSLLLRILVSRLGSFLTFRSS